jgi:hypothetical protein
MARPTGGGRVTCESCLSIDVRDWSRRGFLRSGLEFAWFWNQAGQPCGNISVHVEVDTAVLSFHSQYPGEAKWRGSVQRVPVVWTDCHFGGHRPWFRCTAHSGGQYCGRRVAVLYGVGDVFACRRCCGLAYVSQQESLRFRQISRSRKIRMRLGGGPNVLAPFPDKPRRMHWRTYMRLRARDRFAS